LKIEVSYGVGGGGGVKQKLNCTLSVSLLEAFFPFGLKGLTACLW